MTNSLSIDEINVLRKKNADLEMELAKRNQMLIDAHFQNKKLADELVITQNQYNKVVEQNKELQAIRKLLAIDILRDLQIACFKNQIIDTIFHYPVPTTTLYDYIISICNISQKEFDELTDDAMKEGGI